MKREKTNYIGVFERKSNQRNYKGRPDICYEITYKHNGKKIREKAGWASEGYTAKLASIVRAERLRNIRHGEELPHDRKKIPYFRDIAQEYIEWARKNKTRECSDDINRYEKHLKNEFENKRLDQISTLDIEKFKNKLIESGLAPATQKHILVLFRQIFNKGTIWHKLDMPNPIKGVKLPKLQNSRIRFFSYEEANLLLKALKKNKQLHDMALLSLRTGLRFQEITGLKGYDLDFENEIIHILDPKNTNPKSAEESNVYMTPDIKSLLSNYNVAPNELLFKNKNGKRINQLSRTFQRTIKRLGFNEGIIDRRQILTFHSLRHTFANWLALNGEQLKTIQELMRHKTIQMTIKYAHLIPDQKKEAVKNIIK